MQINACVDSCDWPGFSLASYQRTNDVILSKYKEAGCRRRGGYRSLTILSKSIDLFCGLAPAANCTFDIMVRNVFTRCPAYSATREAGQGLQRLRTLLSTNLSRGRRMVLVLEGVLYAGK